VIVLFFPLVSLSGERPDFTGHWKLNRLLSDYFQQKIRAALDAPERQNYGTDRGTIGYADSYQQADERVLGSTLVGQMPLDSLFLELSDVKFTLQDGEGHPLTLFTDGRVQKFQRLRGDAELMTRWVNGELITVVRAPGTTVITTYNMAPGGCQMSVETRMSTPQLAKPLIIRYVYDYDSPESICSLIPAEGRAHD
jgi:hypothetical protein